MSALSVSAASTTEVIGHFDYVLDGRAYGWAFTPAQPEKRLAIDIVVDGEIVAHGRAELLRDDLQKAGLGDGHCLFELTLSHELFDGRVHNLTARVSETGTLLNGGPHQVGPERHEPAYPQITRRLGLELFTQTLNEPRYSQFVGKQANLVQAYRLASRLQETDQLVEARSAWVTINKALGSNALIGCKLGECLMLEGFPAKALEAFRAAAGDDLRLHWAHLGIANSQYALGQFEEAEEALQVAIALQPEDTSLRERLYHIQRHGLPLRIKHLIEQGQRDEALALLKASLLRQPDNDQALHLLGDLLCPPINSDLPGLDRLHALNRAQRILNALLDDIEVRYSEAQTR
nr:tetratricopeptide repeat protein [Pseudomonas luteola]